MCSVGKRIKKLRSDLRITQVEFAELIGVSKQTLYKYENDIITNIPSDKIEAAAKVCNVTPAYLMGWADTDNIASGSALSADAEALLHKYTLLSDENKDKLIRYADGLLVTQEGDEVLRQIAAQKEKRA